MRYSKHILILLGFIVVPTGFYLFVKRQNSKSLKWHQTGYPVKRDIKQYISASGRLKAQDQVTVGSLVAGRIEKLYVDDNDFVKKNQVLVELDNGIGSSAVRRDEARLLKAKETFAYTRSFFERQKKLFESGQLAQDAFERYKKDFANAQATVQEVKAQLEIQKQTYDNLHIKAPIDGVIISKKVDLGQMVTSQFQATELFTIAKDLKKMEAEINIDESDIGLVKIGHKAIFTVDAFPQKPLEGKLKQINYDYKVIDNVITYAIIIDVNNPDLVLRPGMTTNVNIQIADIKKALSVPNRALRIDAEILEKVAKSEGMGFALIPKSIETKSRNSLWIVQDNKFKEINVKLGASDSRFTQIKEGLDVKTKIVFEALDSSRENPVLSSVGKVQI